MIEASCAILRSRRSGVQPARSRPIARAIFSGRRCGGAFSSSNRFSRFRGLYHLKGVPVTVCVVATVAWEGLRVCRFPGECSGS